MQGKNRTNQEKYGMNRLKTAIAAALVLAAGMGAGLFAADTNTPSALNLPKIAAPSATTTPAHGWYGPGYDSGTGYFDPAVSEYDPYPYYNIVGGESYAPLYQDSLPDQKESPFNPPAGLTRHGINGFGFGHRMNGLSIRAKTQQALPPAGVSDVH